MTVKLVLFFRPGMISLPGRKKWGIVGTMGPGSVPLANRPNLMAPTRPGPKVSRRRKAREKFRSGMALTGRGPKVTRPRNARENFNPGTAPKGLGPKVSWPRNARMPPFLMRPGARMPLHPDASFPYRQLHQMKLPTGFS